jgi:hypothetical protein
VADARRSTQANEATHRAPFPVATGSAAGLFTHHAVSDKALPYQTLMTQDRRELRREVRPSQAWRRLFDRSLPAVVVVQSMSAKTTLVTPYAVTASTAQHASAIPRMEPAVSRALDNVRRRFISDYFEDE